MFRNNDLLHHSSSDITPTHHYAVQAADMAVYIACESLKSRNNKLQAEKEVLEGQYKYLLKQNQLLLSERGSRSETWSNNGNHSQNSNGTALNFVDASMRRASAADLPLNTRHFASATRQTDMLGLHQSKQGASCAVVREDVFNELRMPRGGREVGGEALTMTGGRVYAQESREDFGGLKLPVVPTDVLHIRPGVVNTVYPHRGVMNTMEGEIGRGRLMLEFGDVAGCGGEQEVIGTKDELYSAEQDGLVSLLMKELQIALTCIEQQKEQLSHLEDIVTHQSITLEHLDQQTPPCSHCGHFPTHPLNQEESNLAVGSGSVIVDTPLPSADFDEKVGIQCTSNPERIPQDTSSFVDAEMKRKALYYENLSHSLRKIDSSPLFTNIPTKVSKQNVTPSEMLGAHAAVSPNTLRKSLEAGISEDLHLNSVSVFDEAVDQSRDAVPSSRPPEQGAHAALSPNTLRKSLEAGISEVLHFSSVSGLNEVVDQSRDPVPSYRPPERNSGANWCIHSGGSLASNSYMSSTNLRICPLCEASFRSDFGQEQFEQHVQSHFPESNIIQDYEII